MIGAGRWGENHVRIYSDIPCELVGIADIDPKAKRLADDFGIRYFREFKQLLPHVDAVSVVVPTNLHYRVVKECLESGKHVLIEKPITLESGQASELIAIARRKGLVLMVGYLFRFNACVRELKRQLENIGDINYITARYVHSHKPPRSDCGVIFNFATHLIDILNFLLDRNPQRVFCKKINYLSKEREDCAVIVLDYGSFMANLEVTWFHPLKKRDMWIIGSEEKVYADFLEQILVRYPIRIGKEKVVSEKEINLEIHKNEPLREELLSFCQRAESGQADGSEGEETITRICELCLESAKTGREVKVRP